MKNLKRFLVLQFLALFLIPVTFAQIDILLPGEGVYNLGDKISPTTSVKLEQDYNGFFKLNIICDNYNLQYYTTPLSLEAGFRTQVIIPDLPLSKSMTGNCKLKANFEVSDGDEIDSAWSEEFLVTDKLNIIIDENLEAKPGEDIIVLGDVKKSNGEFLSKGEAEITFKSEENKVEVVAGKFEHTIHLDSQDEAGKIAMLIVVRDKYGNYGNKISKIGVIPVPTRIENHFESDILMPGDNLKVKAILYDHSGNILNGSRINVRVFDPDENIIAEKEIQNSDYFEFLTGKNQVPGNYFLLSTFGEIKKQDSFSVESVRKIAMEQKDNFIHIRNVGNVDYDDETTIILKSDDKKYLINKKIALKPGEEITIDLSKEVPQGTYDIILPKETVDSGNETTQEVVEQNIIQDVPIDDNRNIIKKTADGMASVTGAVVGAAGYVASRPILASVILVLIILGTVTRYSWGFIKNKIRGKKEDDTENLFDDFKYEEER